MVSDPHKSDNVATGKHGYRVKESEVPLLLLNVGGQVAVCSHDLRKEKDLPKIPSKPDFIVGPEYVK